MSDTDRRKVQIEAALDATGVREGAPMQWPQP